MLGRIFDALSGLRNASKRLQNSVANINTPGFKKSEVNSVNNKSIDTGVNDISTINTQGSLLTPGNPVDLTIDGKGSNVDITDEIVSQIVSKAMFKANVNVIKANNEMLGSTLDIKT
jgi:flagellar basal body rod protein FlgG